MKKMKWLSAFLIFAFCFILNGEMTQNYFTNFTENIYYLDAAPDDRSQLCNVMQQVSAQNHTPVFFVRKEYPSKRTAQITIYIAEQDAGMFRELYGLSAGTYQSLFSGSTEIIYRDFQAIRQDSEVERFYFSSASMQQMERIYQQISGSFRTSYIRRENASGLNLILNVIWILPLLFLLLLTWFAVQFDRKREFLRISLGASKAAIILKAIVSDLAVFGLGFLSVFLLLDRFIYIRYHLRETLLLFAAFLLCNSLVHLTLLRFQYKEILYGANLNHRLLSNCYLMKAAVLILTLFSVSVNIYLIRGQMRYLKYRQTISAYRTASFLSLKPDPDVYAKLLRKEGFAVDEPVSVVMYSAAAGQILCDQLTKDQALFSFVYAETENNGEYICCLNDRNLLGSDALCGLPDDTVDFCYLYPENLPEEYRSAEFAKNMIECIFGVDADTVQYRLIPYDFKAQVLFIDTNLTNGFEIAESPGCLFCNTASPRLQEAIRRSTQQDTTYFQNIMFRLRDSEAEQLKADYHLKECRMTPAAEQFESMQNTMLRIVLLNTVISILMILLNLSIGAAIIRLQYIINAKRLSVMKILGYSVLQMHMPVFILNLFSVIIGWITNLILAFMYHKTDWRLILLAGIGFIAADTAAALIHIRKLERTNTTTILKGGSL